MSSSLIKGNYIQYEKKDKRVIDSNQAVFDRLTLLNEILENSYADDEFADEFSEGIDAVNVSALLEDQDVYSEEEYVAQNQASSVDVSAMLEEANSQAQEIIDGANLQADEILESARQEAENIKNQAYEEGKLAGSEAGYQDGVAKAEQMAVELEEKARALEAEFEQLADELEPKMVDIITDIYTHVFCVDLQDKKGIVGHLLKNAIKNVESTNGYFIHVSDEDYDEVISSKDELSVGLASTCIIEIIEDVTLSKGECFIEADSGIFDCSLGIELENLKKELRLLAYTPS